MLRPRLLNHPRIVNTASITIFTTLLFSQACPQIALAADPSADAAQTSGTQRSDSQQETTAEVSVEAERQTDLAMQTMTISDTPNAGPQPKHLSVVVGAAAGVGPVYLGSKKDRVSPIPYVDVRGILGGRLFISDVSGVGINLVDIGGFRAGLNLNGGGGRKSKDDPRLKGLPDISNAAIASGFVAYWLNPFSFQADIARRVGSHPGTEADVAVAYTVAPVHNLQLNFSTGLLWADAKTQNTIYGISPADAAHATALGNPLSPYSPGSGLVNATGTVTAVYLLGEHWGLLGRIGLNELIGNSAKDSPLTQRTFEPDVAFGVLYVF